MSQKINQLCQTIAKNPSKINLINEALSIASQEKLTEGYLIILRLFQKMINIPSLKSFFNIKLQLLFQLLLMQIVQQQNFDAMSNLSFCFKLAENKHALLSLFLQQISKKADMCSYGWPCNLLIAAYDYFSNKNQGKDNSLKETMIKFIIDIPHFKQLNVAAQEQIIFKKSFQRFLLSVIGDQSLQKKYLYEIYHNLGQKVLSKLLNPLVLSNHCLSRFAMDPEIQIEVLSCLFLLVGKYGLQLQEFYPKLQNLIKYRRNGYSIYELPNSKRFFRLIEAALRSSKVPFKIICNMTKLIISQISSENSQFAFWALSFVINLTKKHRKLLDQIPQLAQIKILKHHYNSKIKKLVQQLSRNLNKMDYYEIQQFVDLNNEEIVASKMESLHNSLGNQDIQFKLPMIYDKI